MSLPDATWYSPPPSAARKIEHRRPASRMGVLDLGCAEILWQAVFVEGGMPSASFAGHAVTHAGNMPTQQRRGHATHGTNMRCALDLPASVLSIDPRPPAD